MLSRHSSSTGRLTLGWFELELLDRSVVEIFRAPVRPFRKLPVSVKQSTNETTTVRSRSLIRNSVVGSKHRRPQPPDAIDEMGLFVTAARTAHGRFRKAFEPEG